MRGTFGGLDIARVVVDADFAGHFVEQPRERLAIGCHRGLVDRLSLRPGGDRAVRLDCNLQAQFLRLALTGFQSRRSCRQSGSVICTSGVKPAKSRTCVMPQAAAVCICARTFSTIAACRAGSLSVKSFSMQQNGVAMANFAASCLKCATSCEVGDSGSSADLIAANAEFQKREAKVASNFEMPLHRQIAKSPFATADTQLARRRTRLRRSTRLAVITFRFVRSIHRWLSW